MPSYRQILMLYICCLLQLHYVLAQNNCKSRFYSIPTAKGAAFPGGWALITSTSATAYCKKKGFLVAGAIRTRTLSSFARKRTVAVNIATEEICTAGRCVALVGVECVRAGAEPCVADADGNLGRSNVGKDNFGTKNRGSGNIGNGNDGSLCSGKFNRGASLTGYYLSGYNITGPNLYRTYSTVFFDRPPAPALQPLRSPPPKNSTPPPPPPETSPPPDNARCPPCDCDLDIYDPDAPPSPSPPPAPPGEDDDYESVLPSSCNNPCFKYDPENKTCSKSVCTDPCEDCFQSGGQTSCLGIFGLVRFDTEAACNANANCPPSAECLKCSDGKWGCTETFKKKKPF